MTKQKLEKARKYEALSEKVIRPEDRPKLHLSPRTGWMNDPNGFSYYNGQYHMFYQYYPYDVHWGPMHWGHAVSKDLLHWEYLPAVMAPEDPYDINGCFSGSAIEMPDGRHLLMYTGVVRKPTTDGKHEDIQTQCVAIGNGLDYEKYENNPVLDETDLPEGGSKIDFRDPKMWIKKDGTYNCVIGNRSADGSGQILLFSSTNGLQWKYEKALINNNNRYGKMWECPDFFELDGKGVLLVSPQDMEMKDYEFHSGNVAIGIVGSYDEKNDEFMEESFQSLDHGIDFYAPQTTVTPDGRRVAIGWLQNWDTIAPETPDAMWFGQMSLPRELSVKNGKLYQKPLRELLNLRQNKVCHKNVEIEDCTVQLDGVKGRSIDMEVVLPWADMKENCSQFEIRLAQNETYFTALKLTPGQSMLEIDRTFSGSRRGFLHQRSCLVNQERDQLKLRIILDRFSVEVFINDGEQVMSMTIYTDQQAEGITFKSVGKTIIDVEKYDL